MSKLRVTAKYWLPALVWMVLIFSVSSDTQSSAHSSRIIEPLVRWLFPHLQSDQISLIVLFFRKCAHLTEYAVLAVLLWHALRALSSRPTGWSWRVARNAWFVVVAYAITDEVHQVFVPSRTGSPWDVLLDSIGGAAGLLLLWAWGRWRKWW